ncbi:MAG: glycosyltransferase family 2 protein [Sulfuricurvum sp.]|nr:glycosyltransferase family 2 protein [Sulfuricurvum sp.]
MENTPSNIDISFITINYNSSHHTIALVQSIIAHTLSDLNYEIIVVDNASEVEDYTNLHDTISSFPQVSIIRNRINNGFAGGNMLGVNSAHGKYYFFINNDCQLLNDTGSIMKNFLDAHDDIAVVTAKVTDEKGHFSSSYKQFPSVIKQWFGNSIHRALSSKSFPSNKIHLETPTAVEIISGACMFFRAEDFNTIGGFDTIFFLYCEEEDICKRVWNYGKQIYFLPEAEVFHAGGGSSIHNVALEKEFYISYKLLIDKHFNYFARFFIKMALTLKQFRRIFTKRHGLSLFLFVASGSPIRDSLRYKQKIQLDKN